MESCCLLNWNLLNLGVSVSRVTRNLSKVDIMDYHHPKYLNASLRLKSKLGRYVFCRYFYSENQKLILVVKRSIKEAK